MSVCVSWLALAISFLWQSELETSIRQIVKRTLSTSFARILVIVGGFDLCGELGEAGLLEGSHSEAEALLDGINSGTGWTLEEV